MNTCKRLMEQCKKKMEIEILVDRQENDVLNTCDRQDTPTMAVVRDLISILTLRSLDYQTNHCGANWQKKVQKNKEELVCFLKQTKT